MLSSSKGTRVLSSQRHSSFEVCPLAKVNAGPGSTSFREDSAHLNSSFPTLSLCSGLKRLHLAIPEHPSASEMQVLSVQL